MKARKKYYVLEVLGLGEVSIDGLFRWHQVTNSLWLKPQKPGSGAKSFQL